MFLKKKPKICLPKSTSPALAQMLKRRGLQSSDINKEEWEEEVKLICIVADMDVQGTGIFFMKLPICSLNRII